MKWLVGYVADIVIPSLFQGAGFNSTPAYINISWVHNSGDVDYYEIWYSNDNTTYSLLNTTLLKVYKDDYSLNNGSYRYYKIRTVYYHIPTTTWYNSSYTPINLERCWLVLTGGGGTTNIGLFNNFIIIGIFGILATVGLKVRKF